MQARFIPALAAVHNFIQVHEPVDRLRKSSSSTTTESQSSLTTETVDQASGNEEDEEELANRWEITPEERRRAGAERDRIAKDMWNDYQAELRRRGL